MSTTILNVINSKSTTLSINNVSTEDVSIGSSTAATISADGLLTINNTTNSTTKDNGALVIDGGVGIESDVNIGGTLNIGGTSVKDVLVNPSAYNSLLLFDDQLTTTTDFGTYVGTASRTDDASPDTGYIELIAGGELSSEGIVSWKINPGNSFSIEYDLYVGHVDGADVIWFGWFLNSDANSLGTNFAVDDGGYKMGFDMYNGGSGFNEQVELAYQGVDLSTSDFPYDAYDGAYHRIKLTYVRGKISMYINNTLVKTYTDIERSDMYNHDSHIAFGSFTGAISTTFRIRNIKLSKLSEGIWRYSSMTDVQDISYTGGNVNIANTTTSTNTTSGALQVAGGTGIVENLNVGGNITVSGELNVSGHELTPNTEDITKQLTFSGANNQVAVANVTGLVFTTGVTESFTVQMSIKVLATVNLYSQIKIEGVQNSSGWHFIQNFVGDNPFVTLSITPAGQVQYTSGNYTGFVSLTMKFKVATIEI